MKRHCATESLEVLEIQQSSEDWDIITMAEFESKQPYDRSQSQTTTNKSNDEINPHAHQFIKGAWKQCSLPSYVNDDSIGGINDFLRTRRPGQFILSTISKSNLRPENGLQNENAPANDTDISKSIYITPPKHQPSTNNIIINTTLLNRRKLRAALFSYHKYIIERDVVGADVLVSPSCGIYVVNQTEMGQRSFSGVYVFLQRLYEGLMTLDEVFVLVEGSPVISLAPVSAQLTALDVKMWWCGKNPNDVALWVLDIAQRYGSSALLEEQESVHERFLCSARINPYAAQQILRQGQLRDIIQGKVQIQDCGKKIAALVSMWKTQW